MKGTKRRQPCSCLVAQGGQQVVVEQILFVANVEKHFLDRLFVENASCLVDDAPVEHKVIAQQEVAQHFLAPSLFFAAFASQNGLNLGTRLAVVANFSQSVCTR